MKNNHFLVNYGQIDKEKIHQIKKFSDFVLQKYTNFQDNQMTWNRQIDGVTK